VRRNEVMKGPIGQGTARRTGRWSRVTGVNLRIVKERASAVCTLALSRAASAR
jgi:hypothetical protein